MALEGFLQEFGLADILQLIYFQKKTGILNIESKADRIKLSLINGDIASLESKKRSEEDKLGRILVKKGLITLDNLNAVLKIHEKEKISLGHIFLRRGLVPKEVLLETIQNQIIESIAHIFTWKEGRYEFIPRELPVDRELPISLNTQRLLMDGLRIIDEWSLIEAKLNLDAIFEKLKEPEGRLNDEEKEVLELVDGESDVSTIIFLSHMGEFETAKSLISLEEQGIIAHQVTKPVEEKIAPVEILEKPFPLMMVVIAIAIAIVLFMFKGDYEVFRILKQAGVASKIERLRTRVDIYNVTNGRYPENIGAITTEKDRWGRPYIYKLTKSGFQLFSAGPDGIEGTKDDVY